MSTLRGTLGHSVIAEELKGDFAKAATVAQRSAAKAERTSSQAEKNDAQLDLALVQTLQGLPAAALETLRFTPDERALTSDQRARLAALRNTAVHLCYNTFPGGEGAGGAHLALEWDAMSYGADEQTRWREVPLADCSPAVSREARLLHDTLCKLKSARSFVVPGPWTTEGDREQLFGTAMQVPLELVQSRSQVASDPVSAFGFLAAADLCRRARHSDATQQFVNEARRRYAELGDQAGLANCWVLLGDILCAPFTTPLYHNLPVEDVRDVSSAVSDELVEMAQAAPAPQVSAARKAYECARTCFSKAAAPRGLGAIELREAYLAGLATDVDNAVLLAKQATERFGSAGDHLNSHLAATHELLHRINRYPFEWDPQRVQDIGAWGRSEGSVSWALGLGLLLTASGRIWLQEHADGDRSITCYRHALVLYEALGAEVNAAQCLVDRAEVHRALNETDACISLSLQGLNGYLDCRQDHPGLRKDLQLRLTRLAESLYWLHAAAVDADGMERSADRLRESLEELRGLEALASGGRQSESEQLVIRSASSALSQSAVMIPLYRGKSLLEDGLAESARPHFDQALSEVSRLGSPVRGRLEALVRGTSGDSEGAARAFEKRFEHGQVPIEDVAAEALAAIRRSSPETALEMEHKLELEEHLNAFYFLVQMDAFDDAERHLGLVEARIGRDWWRSEERPWESLVRRAELFAGLGDHESALGDVDQCIDLLDEARARLPRDTQRTALSGSRLAQHVYSLGIRCAHRLMKSRQQERSRWLELSYRYAEQGKGRALLDLLAAVETGQAPSQPSWVRAWRVLNARLSTWFALIAEEQAHAAPREARLEALRGRQREDERRLQALTDALAKEHARFHALVSPGAEASSIAQVVEHLPPGSLLLQYQFAGDDFFAWAVDGDGAADLHHASYDALQIAREIRGFHAACSGGGTWQIHGERLSRIFLTPFEKRLESFENVVIVPSSHAHRLPFHALPWANGVFSSRHNLSYIPSGSVAQYLQGPALEDLDTILAIGDPADMSLPSAPDGQKRALPPLPAAALEARYVASLDPGSRALIAEEATIDRIRPALPKYHIVHFATHGVLNERAPLSSAILLANGESLTAADFLGIDLNADLVVLSGCRTGLGDLTAGDEVVGLTRALLASGARAALVSLWPVRDAATSYFMRRFYEKLPALGPARALQSAQTFLRELTPERHRLEREKFIEAIEDAGDFDRLGHGRAVRDLSASHITAALGDLDFSHPYFWAPFTYVGIA